MNSDNQDDLIYEPEVYSATTGLVYAVVALVALVIGVGLALFYTWEIAPPIEQNTFPNQLRNEDKQRYIAAIADDYAYSCATGRCDLVRAYNLLAQLDPSAENPFQLVADAVCEITYSGTVRTGQTVQDILTMIELYQSQGVVAECDLTVFATSPPPTPAPLVPTLTPMPSANPISTKTPTIERPSSSIPTLASRPTQVTGEFAVQSVLRNCDPRQSGIIAVYVRQLNTGIPGVRIQVTWNTPTGQLQQSFYTGLKPDRSDGYADFQMEAGNSYLVQLPGLSPPTERLQAQTCDDAGTLYSYEVVFQAQ